VQISRTGAPTEKRNRVWFFWFVSENQTRFRHGARLVLCETARMSFVSAATLLAVVVTSAFAGQTRSPASACGVSALVTHVFDGDTLDAAGVGRVRLLGIDAPERGGRFEQPAPFALEAHERLRALVLRRWVRFECEGPRRDDYRRHLAWVFVGGRMLVNAELVREGLARVSARTRLQHWDALRQAEEEAQTRRRGIWGDRPRIPDRSYMVP
jgi:micrococcal nuclease